MIVDGDDFTDAGTIETYRLDGRGRRIVPGGRNINDDLQVGLPGRSRIMPGYGRLLSSSLIFLERIPHLEVSKLR